MNITLDIHNCLKPNLGGITAGGIDRRNLPLLKQRFLRCVSTGRRIGLHYSLIICLTVKRLCIRIQRVRHEGIAVFITVLNRAVLKVKSSVLHIEHISGDNASTRRKLITLYIGIFHFIFRRICRHRQNIVQQQNRCHAQHPKSFLSLFQFSVHSTLLLTYFPAIIYPKWRKPSRTVLSFDSLPYSHLRSVTGICDMRSPCAAASAIISVANSMPAV